MKKISAFSSELLRARELYVENQRLYKAIDAVLNETDAYAADELVVLAEEILYQIAAVGIAAYLNQPVQKEVYNDFLIGLFNSSGHDYNAGPIYRWAANMIREIDDFCDSEKGRFFWETENKNLILRNDIHRLAELRNAVMHGFFVLPPERNLEEANKIARTLIDLYESRFFDVPNEYHFISKQAFTGQWKITEEDQWVAFDNDTAFGKLSQRILRETGEAFREEECSIFAKGNPNGINPDIRTFIENNETGALACWIHPDMESKSTAYLDVGAWLCSQPDIKTLALRINAEGLSYTGSFLLQHLQEMLDPNKQIKTKDKKPADWLPNLRKQVKEKVVVLLDGIQLAMFSNQHITQLNQLLGNSGILLIAVGQHFRYLERFFNASCYPVDRPNPAVPDIQSVMPALHNYLRFKGPSAEKPDEREDVKILEIILETMLKELRKKKTVVARKFADDHDFNIEYVHEIMDVLAPWIPLTREKFEEDEVDELHGFPSKMTEVTPIYLALGRRDVKLEYQHKILSV
jgi:hypothetical protein